MASHSATHCLFWPWALNFKTLLLLEVLATKTSDIKGLTGAYLVSLDKTSSLGFSLLTQQRRSLINLFWSIGWNDKLEVEEKKAHKHELLDAFLTPLSVLRTTSEVSAKRWGWASMEKCYCSQLSAKSCAPLSPWDDFDAAGTNEVKPKENNLKGRKQSVTRSRYGYETLEDRYKFCHHEEIEKYIEDYRYIFTVSNRANKKPWKSHGMPYNLLRMAPPVRYVHYSWATGWNNMLLNYYSAHRKGSQMVTIASAISCPNLRYRSTLENFVTCFHEISYV